jgi:hypothetical protein
MIAVSYIIENLINKFPAGQECLYDYTSSGLHNTACHINLLSVLPWTDEWDSVVLLHVQSFHLKATTVSCGGHLI